MEQKEMWVCPKCGDLFDKDGYYWHKGRRLPLHKACHIERQKELRHVAEAIELQPKIGLLKKMRLATRRRKLFFWVVKGQVSLQEFCVLLREVRLN